MTSPQYSPEPPHKPAASPTAQPAAQSEAQSGSKTDAGSIGLIILVILAVIASLVMLISGSANALKIALLASLWAAVLGFFLVVRYRRQAQEAKELLAVERAHAASALTASGTGAADNSEVLAEIRSELEAIRTQIEEISGREWVYEPAALYAEARRIQELERKAGGTDVDERGDAKSVNFTQKSGGAPTADAVAGRLGSQPTHPVSNPLDSLLSEKPAAQPAETPAGKPSGMPKAQPTDQPTSQQAFRPPSFGTPRSNQQQAPAARPASTPPRESQPAAKPQQKKPKQPEFKTDSFQAVRWNQGAAQPTPAAQPKEQPAQGKPAQGQPAREQEAQAPHHRHRKPETDNAPSSSAQVQSQQAAQSSRGRRRSDEKREGAVSVAELMARRQQQQGQNKDVKK